MAATLYWVGGNGDSVNTANDWSTIDPAVCTDGLGNAGAPPGAADIAVFDADCDNDADINLDWNVGEIQFIAGYAGTVTISGTNSLDVDGDVTINGSILDINGQDINIEGSFLNSATVSNNTSTTTFDATSGAHQITSGSATFADVVFDDSAGTATWTFQDDFDANGAFTIDGGSVDLNGFTLNVGATWDINDTFTMNNGTIIFDGTGGIYSLDNNSAAFDGDVIFNNAGGSWSTSATANNFDGDFSILAGTFNNAGQDITVAGNFLVEAGTSTTWSNNDDVRFDGSGAGGPYTIETNNDLFSTIRFNSGDWILQDELRIDDFIIMASGTLDFNGQTIEVQKSITIDSSMLLTGIGTINHIADSGARTLETNGVSIYNYIVATGGVTLLDEATITNNFSITATFNTGGFDFTIGGDYVNTSAFNHDSGEVIFNAASGTSTVTTDTDAFFDLTFNSSAGNATFEMQDALNVDNNLTVTNGTLDLNAQTTAITGALLNNDRILLVGSEALSYASVSGSGIFEFVGDGTGAATDHSLTETAYTSVLFNDVSASNSDTFSLSANTDVNGNVTITDGELDLDGFTLNVSGSWTREGAGSFTHSNGSVVFDATSGIILIDPNGDAFYDLTFDDNTGSATFRPTSAISVDNDLTITDGIFDLNTNNVTLSVVGSLGVGSGASFTVGTGAVTLSGASASYTEANITQANTTWTNGTLNIQSDLTQTLPSGETYGNLQLGPFGAGPVTFTMGSTINGDWIIDSSTVIELSDDVIVTGAMTINGTVNTNGYELDVDGDVEISGTGTLDATDVAGAGDEGDETIFNFAGDFTNNGTFTQDDATIIFDGTTDLAADFVANNGLQVNGTLNTNGYEIDVDGNFTISGTLDTTDDVEGGGLSQINISGNLNMTGGTMTNTDSTFVFDGSGTQTITAGVVNFNNMQLNSANATLQPIDYLDINGDLTLTDGTFDNNTFDQDINIAGDIDADNDDISMGTATTWTVAGNVDFADAITTFDDGTSTLVMTGNGVNLRASGPDGKQLYRITIPAGANVTFLSTVLYLDNILSIDGTFNLNTQITAAGTNADIQISSTGKLLAADPSTDGILNFSWGNSSVSQQDGVLNIFRIYFGQNHSGATGSLDPGIYALTRMDFLHNNASTGTLELLSGSYIFEDTAIFTALSGNYEVDNSVNNPDLTIYGDITMSDSSNTFTWTKGTGTITLQFDGASTTPINFDDEVIEDLIIDDTDGGSKQMVSGFTTDLLAIVNGDLDVNGQAISIAGSFFNSATVSNNTSTVTFSATSGTHEITSGGATFTDVIFDDSAGTATYQPVDAMTVTNSLTLTDGVFDLDANSATVIVNGTLIIDAGASLTSGAGSVFLNATNASYTEANITQANTTWTNGTLNIQTDLDQTLPAGEDYGNLQLGPFGAGPVTFTMGSTISGDWIIDSSTIVELSDDVLVTGAMTINGRVNTNGYELEVNGDLVLTGTLDATDSAGVGDEGDETVFTIGGDFDISAGTFTIDDADFIFDGTTDLTSNSTQFNDIQIGSATAGGSLTTLDNLDINGALSVTNFAATTLDISSDIITSAQTFDLRNLDTFTSTGSTVTFDGTTAQTINSNSLTYNTITVTNSNVVTGATFADAFTAATFNAVTDSQILRFQQSTTFTITGAAGLNWGGSALGDEIDVDSVDGSSAFTLDVTGGAQTVSYVDVSNSTGATNTINATNSVDGGGNGGTWSFSDSTVTRYWVGGAVNTLWSNTGNWSTSSGGASGASVPVTGSTAVFDGSDTDNATIDQAVDVANIRIESGYTGTITDSGNAVDITTQLSIADGVLDLNAATLDIEGTLSVSGGVLDLPSGNTNLRGNFTGTAGTIDGNDGTITFDADGTSTVASGTLVFDNVVINATGTIQFTEDLNVAGNYTYTTGTLDFSTSTTGINFVGDDDNSQDDFTITTGGSGVQYGDLTFDAAEDGGSGVWDRWTLQDDPTATNLTLVDGQLIDNGRTITVNGASNFITYPSDSSILSTTGTLVFDTDGSDTLFINPVWNHVRIPAGRSPGMGTAMRFANLTVEAGADFRMTGGFMHIRSTVDNSLYVDPTADISDTGGTFLFNPVNNVNQQGFALTAAFAFVNFNNTITMTGDLSLGAFSTRGAFTGGTPQDTDPTVALTLDMNGNDLTTTGDVTIASSFSYDGSRLLLDSGTHSFGGNLTSGSSSYGFYYFESSTTTVAGNLDFSYGYAELGTSSIAVAGDIDFTDLKVDVDTPAGADPGTSTVTLNGTADQTLTGANKESNTSTQINEFYNLILNNTGAAGSDDIIVDASLYPLDILNQFTLTDGDFDLATNNPDVSIYGDILIDTNGSITKGSGTITFDSLNYNDSTGVANFGNITLGNTVNLGTNFICDTLTVPTGATLVTNGYNITCDTLDIDGTLTATDGTGGTTTITFTSTADFTNATYTTSIDTTILMATADSGLTMGTTPLAGYLDLDADVNIYGDITVDGSVYTDGYEMLFTGDVDFNGTLDATQDEDADVSTLTISDNWDMTGATFIADQSILLFIGDNDAVADTFTLTFNGNSVFDLTFNGAETGASVDTWQLQDDVDIDGGLLVVDGVLDVNSQDLTFTGTATAVVTPLGAAFNNVTFNGLGAAQWNVGSDVIANGTFDLTDGTLDLSGSNPDLFLYDDVTIAASGVLTVGTGTIVFDGLNFNDAGAEDWGDLYINGTVNMGTNLICDSLTIPAGATLVTNGYNIDCETAFDIDGTLNATSGTGGNTQINIAGTFDLTNATFTRDVVTLVFDGSTTQTLTGYTSIPSTDTVDLDNDIAFSAALTVDGALYSDGYEITIPGNFTLNGTFDGTDDEEGDGSVITITGTAIDLSAGIYTTVSSLALTNVSGVTLTTGATADTVAAVDIYSDVIVAGNIDILGDFTTNGYELDVNGNLTVSAGSLVATDDIEGDDSVITVSGNADFTGGNFVADNSIFRLDGTGAQNLTSPSQTYYNLAITNAAADVSFLNTFTTTNFIAETASTTLKFQDSTTFNVTDMLLIDGQDTATRNVVDTISGGNQFTFDVGAGNAQTIYFVDVNNALASGSDITAVNSLDTNTDSAASSPQFVFTSSNIFIWDAGGDGATWEDEDNWNFDSGYPDDINDIASISVPDTINVTTAIVAQELQITGGGGAINLDVQGSLTIEDLLINRSNARIFNLVSGSGDIDINNNLTLTNGSFNSGGATEKILVENQVIVAATFDGGDGIVEIDGALDQSFTIPDGGIVPGINLNGSPMTTVTFAGAGGVGSPTSLTTMDLTQGAMDFGSGVVTLYSVDLTIGASATLDAASATTVMAGIGSTVDVQTTHDFNNLTLNKSDSYILTIPSGDTLNVTGALTMTNGSFNTGTVDANAAISIASTFDGGSGVLSITGAVDQDFTVPDGARMPAMLLNGNAGTTVTFAGDAEIGHETISSDMALTNGAMDFGSGNIIINNVDTVVTGTTWTATSSTISFEGSTSSLDVNATQTLGAVTLNKNNGQGLGIASGDVISLTGNLTLTDGTIAGGSIELQGNLSEGSTFDGGTTPITFTQSSTQTVDFTNNSNYNGDITINKSGGARVNLSTPWVLDAASQDFILTEGTFDISGNDFTVSGAGGTFIIQDGGNLQLEGTETITGTPTFNSGSLATYDATSGTNTILNLSYNSLVLNGLGGTFQSTTAVNVAADFNVINGTVTFAANSNALTIGEDFIISGGSFSGITTNISGVNASYTELNVDPSLTTWSGEYTQNIQTDLNQTLPAGETYSRLRLGNFTGVGGVTEFILGAATATTTTFNDDFTIDADAAVDLYEDLVVTDDLIINGILRTNGYDLNVNGDITVATGTLDTTDTGAGNDEGDNTQINVAGNMNVSAGTLTLDNTTVIFDASSSQTLTMGSNSIDGGANFELNANVIFSGGLIISSAGTLTAHGYDMNVNGDLDVDGTLDATDDVAGDNTRILVSGDLDFTGGTFTTDQSVFIFDGNAAQSVTTAGESYYTIRVSNGSAAGVTFADAFSTTNFSSQQVDASIYFDAGSTYTISNELILDGQAATDEITIDTSSGAGQFTFNLGTNNPQDIYFVNVFRSVIFDDASGNSDVTCVACTDTSTDSGDATNTSQYIFFTSTDYTWDGTSDGDGDGTTWTLPTNWDLDSGFPDDEEDKAIFNMLPALSADSDILIPASSMIVVGDIEYTGSEELTFDIQGSLETQYLRLRQDDGIEFALESGSSDVVVKGVLQLTNGIFTTIDDVAVIDADGAIITVSSTFDGGEGVVAVTGNFDQSFSVPDGGFLPGFRLNGNNNTTITFAGDATIGDASALSESEFTINQGSVSFGSGLITMSETSFNIDADNTSVSSSGTILFTGSSTTIDFDGQTVGFNDVSINLTSNSDVLTLSSSALRTTGDLDLINGLVSGSGTLNARSNVAVQSTYDGGDALLLFSGSANQTFDLTGAEKLYNGNIQIDKDSGTLSLLSGLEIDTTNQSLTLTDGNFDINGNDFELTGTNNAFTIDSGGVFRLMGGETVTAPTSIVSNGVVLYDGASGPYTINAWNYSNLTINGTAGEDFNLPDVDLTVGRVMTLTSGDVIFDNDKNLTISNSNAATNALSITANATIQNTGTGNLTLGGGVSNAGTMTFNSSDDAGNAIQFRSTSSGTQRNWQGAGTFSFTDVDVQDQTAIGGSPTEIIVTSGTNSGNNVNWAIDDGGAVNTVGGTIYTSLSEISTANNAPITIVVWNNAVLSSFTETTDGSGAFSRDVNALSSGDSVLIYIDNGSPEGNLVYVSDGSNVADLKLYTNRITLRDDAGAGITNAMMASLDDGDDDIKYTVTGSDISVDDNFSFYVPSTYSYIPGGNVELYSLDLDGTITTTNATTITVSSAWDSTGGVFTNGGATVVFDGSTTLIAGSATFGSVTITGSLTPTTNSVDINGDVSIGASGSFINTANQNIFVSGDWANAAGGSWTPGTSTITFDTTNTSTIRGSNTFYNFTSTTAGKTIQFQDGTNQTISGTLTIDGASGNLITLESVSPGVKWDITPSSASQEVEYVNVSDSDANTNSILCVECTNGGNNNSLWLFGTTPQITVPTNGASIERTPIIIGSSAGVETIEILDADDNILATTTPHSNGNFVVAIATALDVGAIAIRPRLASLEEGNSVIALVVSSPTTAQQPTVTTSGALTSALPTIIGEAAPSATVTLYAWNDDASFPVQVVGTGTSNASGAYSITLSTALNKGSNNLIAVVNGSPSNVSVVSFTDPFGIVFDSESNEPLENAVVTLRRSDGTDAVVGVDIAATDINPYITSADGFFSFFAADGSYYMDVDLIGYDYPSVETVFSSDRTIITGSKAEAFTVAGIVLEMDQPLDSNDEALIVRKTANKKDVRVGDVVTWTVTIENPTDEFVPDVILNDKIPPGFKLLEDRVLYENQSFTNISGKRPVKFTLGQINSGQITTLRYQTVVGSGVEPGDYSNIAYAMFSGGRIISNTASDTVSVVLDPLFDLSTIIGKIYFADNKGMPTGEPVSFAGVRIVMENGIMVFTDSEGKFSVPGLNPGRHVFRIDKRTLPSGVALKTDEVVLIDMRPGLLHKVNFGVQRTGAASSTDDVVLPERTWGPQSQTLQQVDSAVSDWFFVSLGEVTVGKNEVSGNIEPVQSNDKFNEGYWTEGKGSFYLEGKIQGKYLLQASFDSEREENNVFKNIDKDEYYPVYGDASRVSYAASDTQGPLYVSLTWDKSKAVIGNYKAQLNETQFAQFNRTLYGAQLDYVSASNTPYGDPDSKILIFGARSQQRAAHNEFLSTGGSLYYLKHQNIFPGSAVVRIEVRDEITAEVKQTYEPEVDIDYALDYGEGRLRFNTPVNLLVDQDNLINNDVLDGHPVYLVIDYEYESQDKLDDLTYGGRIQKAIEDEVIIGATLIEEAQADQNYRLQGVDLKYYMGIDSTVTVEYAESQSQALGAFVSTDGGLSFIDTTTGDAESGNAFGIKADIGMFYRWNVSAYYEQIDKGFSSASITPQQGKKLSGFQATYDLADNTTLSLRRDVQELLSDGTAETQLQLKAQKTTTTIIELAHQYQKLRLTAQYSAEDVESPLATFDKEESVTETLSIQADYQLTDKTIVSVKQQQSLGKEEDERQTILAARTKIIDGVALEVEQSFGADGQSTKAGVGLTMGDGTFNVKSSIGVVGDDGFNLSQQTSIGATMSDEEGKELTTGVSFTGDDATLVTLGTKQEISEDVSLRTEQQLSLTNDQQQQDSVVGLQRTKDGRTARADIIRRRSQTSTEESFTDLLRVSSEVRQGLKLLGSVERGEVTSHDGSVADRVALAFVAEYERKNSDQSKQWLKGQTKIEYRQDDGDTDQEQFFAYQKLEGRLTDALTVFLSGEYSISQNTSLDATTALFKEFSIGAAYRPLANDRLNFLGQYTFIEDDQPVGQIGVAEDVTRERAQVFSIEGIYDITDRWQLTQKLAYRWGKELVSGFEWTESNTWLTATRVSYKVTDKWRLAAEYRQLTQELAQDVKRGALVEASYDIHQFMELALGYNFTDFSDDLTSLDYTVRGPYMRLSSKIYNRDEKELAQIRQKKIDARIDDWAYELVEQTAKEVEGNVGLIYEQAIVHARRWFNLMSKVEQFRAMAREQERLRSWEQAYHAEEQALIVIEDELIHSSPKIPRIINYLDDQKIKIFKNLRDIEPKYREVKQRMRNRSRVDDIKEILSIGLDLYRIGHIDEARAVMIEILPLAKEEGMQEFIDAYPMMTKKKEKLKKHRKQREVAMVKNDVAYTNLSERKNEGRERHEERMTIKYKYREAIYYIRHHRYDLAIEVLKEILEADPSQKRAMKYLDKAVERNADAQY